MKKWLKRLALGATVVWVLYPRRQPGTARSAFGMEQGSGSVRRGNCGHRGQRLHWTPEAGAYAGRPDELG